MAAEEELRPEREGEQLKGRSVERLEDGRILSGRSEYVDDIELPNMLHARIFRSSRAHARLEDVDVSEAREMDGVVDVLTGAEANEMADRYGKRRSGMTSDHPPLADEKVRHTGEGIVAVAAESHYRAGDALEAIDVTYDALPNVLDAETALDADSPEEFVHDELQDDPDVDGNVWGNFNIDVGDVDEAFASADHVVEMTMKTSRPSAVPMETHGAVAEYDPADEKLTLYTCTQEAHQVRTDLANVLGMPMNKVRVQQPENMGGGFGHKLELHENEVVAALLSIRNERPVKVVLGRTEEFQATRARQPQIHEMALALDEDGTFRAIRDDITAEAGAYAGLTKPGMWVSCNFIAPPYWIENIDINGRCVFTNTVPSGAYRGFGLTQAATAREALLDKAATELGFDPWELRRRNLPSNEECPIDHPIGFHLDSCGILECFDLVEEDIDWDLLDADTDDGVVRGLGVAGAMHVSSAQRPAYTSDNSSVTIRMEEDGSVAVANDQCPMGTGIETAIAQIVADELGVDHTAIDLDFADSETTPFGLGSWGSRGIAISGSAAYEAARTVRDKLRRIAGFQLDADPSDLVVEGGTVFDPEDPSRSLSIPDLAYDAHYNGTKLPEGMTAGAVQVTESFDNPAPGPLDEKGRSDISVNYPTNVHAAVVEVDTETGDLEILDYAIADDVGEVINPMIVEGQIQGGTVQGIGMAVGEDLEYNPNGQLVNGSMEDYQIPLANETPMLTKITEAETTSERAPLGTKGVGESGAIPSPAAILNAVNDALLGEYIDEPATTLPLSGETIFSLCRGEE
jgi:carbon-monoxide dehydrogenase large subunit